MLSGFFCASNKRDYGNGIAELIEAAFEEDK